MPLQEFPSGPEPGPAGVVGTGWIPDVKVLASSQNQRNASVTRDGAGNLYVAFEDWYPTYAHWRILVYTSQTGGTTWSYVTGAQSAAYDLLRPSIAATLTPSDIMVAYERGNGGNGIGVFKYIGSTWSAATVDTVVGTHRPALTFDTFYTNGAYGYLAYEYDAGASGGWDILFSRSLAPPFDTWESPTPIVGGTAGDTSVNRNPSIAYGGNANLYVAYERGTPGSRDIYMMRNTGYGESTPTNYWSADPGTQVSGPDDDFDASVALGHDVPEGVLTWTRAYGGTDDDIWFSYTLDSGGNWSTERCMACRAGVPEEGATVSTDLTSLSFRVAYRAGANEIYYTEAISYSPGIWASAQNVIDAAGSASSAPPRVAVSSFCNAAAWCYPAVVWTDMRGASSDILYSTTISRIQVGPAPVTLVEGASQVFSAIALVGADAEPGWEATGTSFTWSVTGGIGDVTPVLGTSTTFTAGACVGGSSGGVVASNGINGSASVTIASSSTPSAVSVFPPSASVPAGASRSFNATVRDACARDITSTATITWSVTGGIGTVSPVVGPSTAFTAFPSAGGTTGSVVATSSPVLGYATTIVGYAGPLNLTVSPPFSTVYEGGSVALAASVRDVGYHGITNESTIAWSVAPSCGGVSPSSGPNTTFTSLATAGGQTCVVDASASYQTWTSNVSVRVDVAHTGPILVTMSPSAGIVLAGESRSFYAAVTDANGHNITDLTLILWSVPSSCGSVSPGVGPVATFTAAASAGGAYCMINATGTYISWSDADTAYVTVLYNGPVTVTVTPPNATLLRGGSQTFDAVTTDVGGHDVGAYTIVSWAATPVACGSFDPITNWRTTFTANLSAGGQTCTLTATGRFLGGSQQWIGSGSASVVVLPPDFDLSISPTSQAVTAGYQSQYTIAIAARNGFDSLVDLSIAGLPSGATADFMPSGPVTPGGVRLTISTTASTPPGTYTLALQGTSGTLVHLTNATLVVEALRDFSLAVAPSSRSVLPGESATFTITLTAINGFDTWATLTATGLPAGATASFSPATMTATQPSTLVILTSPSVVPGSYRVTVTGASGGVLYGAVHNQTVTLQVAESPSAIPAMIWWIVPAVAFAAILVAFVLVRTRRKKSKTADAGGDAGP